MFKRLFNKSLKHKNYPITVSFAKEHYEEIPALFKKVRPHKEAFIGVCVLDGSYMCGDPEGMYKTLEFGERLTVFCDDIKNVKPLEIRRNDGSFIGTLPFDESILPNMLMSRGINVFCYVEATDFTAGLFSVAVSIYCEKY